MPKSQLELLSHEILQQQELHRQLSTVFIVSTAKEAQSVQQEVNSQGVPVCAYFSCSSSKYQQRFKSLFKSRYIFVTSKLVIPILCSTHTQSATRDQGPVCAVFSFSFSRNASFCSQSHCCQVRKRLWEAVEEILRNSRKLGSISINLPQSVAKRPRQGWYSVSSILGKRIDTNEW